MTTRLRFNSNRPDGSNVRQRLQKDILGHFEAMRSTRKLVGHTSCVNALAWSNGQAQWLASGGDDNKILLWNVYGDLDTPVESYTGPRGNIFSIAFSSANTYMYAGGTSGAILQHDVTRLPPRNQPPQSGSGGPTSVSPVAELPTHLDSVRDLSSHPSNDSILLSTGEDGTIALHDVRASDYTIRPVSTINLSYEGASAQFNPRVEHIFVSADSYGSVWLRDTRMAFTSMGGPRSKGVVLEYATKLAKPDRDNLCHPESSSVAWDREGSKLAVTFLQHMPTLYSMNDPHPVAVFCGNTLPDGSALPVTEKGYYNTSTLKHGSFYGDSYYIAGSDDFRTYIWKIPTTESLLSQRKVISRSSWADEAPGTVAYKTNQQAPYYVPLVIGTPAARLGGHKSIVNTTVAHPHLPLLATSGIESYVRLHRTVSQSASALSGSASDQDGWTSGYSPTRQLPDEVESRSRRRVMLALMTDRRDENGMLSDTNDEESTIALFDEILREEGGHDVFDTRPIRYNRLSNTEDTDSDSDEGMGSDESDEITIYD